MKIKLNEDYGTIPSGSSILVQKTTAKFYYGIWASSSGTIKVKIPKSFKSITISQN